MAPPSATRAAAESVLAVLAAALLVVAAVVEAQRETIRVDIRVWELVLAGVGAALAIGAAAAARHSARLTGWLLGGALHLALIFSVMANFVRSFGIVVLLLAALSLVLAPILRREGEPGVDYSRGHTAVGVVAVTLMLLIGPFYFGIGLLAPEELVPVAMVAYLLMLVGTAWLAIRQSWWAAAGPVLAVSLWYGVLSVGEYFFGWTA